MAPLHRAEEPAKLGQAERSVAVAVLRVQKTFKKRSKTLKKHKRHKFTQLTAQPHSVAHTASFLGLRGPLVYIYI